MNEDLMILRGRLMTLQSEQQQQVSEFRLFSRAVSDLRLAIDSGNPTDKNTQIDDRLRECTVAIQKMTELRTAILATQNEIERIKPMTGL